MVALVLKFAFDTLTSKHFSVMLQKILSLYMFFMKKKNLEKGRNRRKLYLTLQIRS